MSKPITLEKEALQFPTIDPGVRIGHVHLKVADLQRALDFYCGVLGFTLTTSRPGAAFISAGGYHHHLGLNTWESRGGSPPAPGTTGLYHTAILYPTRKRLADALRRLIVAKIPLEGASDHGVSEALYLCDPDDNGVELYWDRPQDEWPRDEQGKSPTARCRCTRTRSISTICSRSLIGRTNEPSIFCRAKRSGERVPSLRRLASRQRSEKLNHIDLHSCAPVAPTRRLRIGSCATNAQDQMWTCYVGQPTMNACSGCCFRKRSPCQNTDKMRAVFRAGMNVAVHPIGGYRHALD